MKEAFKKKRFSEASLDRVLALVARLRKADDLANVVREEEGTDRHWGRICQALSEYEAAKGGGA